MPLNLADPEIKTEVDELIATAVSEATTGLSNKNKQLLAQEKRLKAQIAAGAADPDAFIKLQEDLEKTQADLGTAQGNVAKLTRERDKATATAASIDKDFNGELTKTGLTGALVKANVNSELLPGALALLGPKVAVVVKDGKREVTAGDKSLGDFITEWAQSAEGKNYVNAKVNGGGDANPGNKVPGNGGKTMTRTAFDALDQAGRAAFSKESGTVVDG